MVAAEPQTTASRGHALATGGATERPDAPLPASRDEDEAPLGIHGSSTEERVAVPTSLRRDDLLRAYYESLLDEEAGDLRRVAGRAGRKLRVLQAELERLGVRLQRGLPLAPAKRSA